MSHEIILHVDRVHKEFKIWRSPHDRLKGALYGLISDLVGSQSRWGRSMKMKRASLFRSFVALDSVSFTAKRGEILGIVGRNGSGKSTLLQLIAGTLEPTSGNCIVRGRIAALLELGSGFNPDFTGRENVRLNAALLGIPPDQIERKMEAIISFAEIGDFIDQPVKTYSSGMAVRLAFAVQVQLEPDLLIIDEALAVGDEPFQRKCFAEIQSLRERGTTILFVSHSAWAVTELCDRAFLLDHGKLLLSGSPKSVIKGYQKLCYASPENVGRVKQELVENATKEFVSAPGQKENPIAHNLTTEEDYFLETLASPACHRTPEWGASIADVGIYDSTDRQVNVLVKGRDYRLRYKVNFSKEFRQVRFGWTVKTLSGLVIAGSATHLPGTGIGIGREDQKTLSFYFQCRFTPGDYVVDIACRSADETDDRVIHGVIDALMFKVKPTPQEHRNGYFDCLILPHWEIE